MALGGREASWLLRLWHPHRNHTTQRQTSLPGSRLEQTQLSECNAVSDSGHSVTKSDTQRAPPTPSRNSASFPPLSFWNHQSHGHCSHLEGVAVALFSKDGALGDCFSLHSSYHLPPLPHAPYNTHLDSAIESTRVTVPRRAEILKPDYDSQW